MTVVLLLTEWMNEKLCLTLFSNDIFLQAKRKKITRRFVRILVFRLPACPFSFKTRVDRLEMKS